MIRKLTPQAHTTLRQAEVEARRRGSRSIEAEHLLLALSRGEGTDAHAVLLTAGLDQITIDSALEREFRNSLLAAGISIEGASATPGSPDPGRRIRMGQSAKLVWQRAVKVAAKRSDKHLDTTHLLLGLLRAPVGTVPRALDEAGVDRSDLVARAEQALAGYGT